MHELPHKHPDVFKQFTKGSFVVHKTKHAFSSIALDHAHEQANALVEGEGGAVGLTQDAAALRRWMVAGPEVSRMIAEFEGCQDDKERRHHEQRPGVQKSFVNDVLNVVSTLKN